MCYAVVMDLILFDLNEALITEWAQEFAADPRVTTTHTDLATLCQNHEFDAIVSPANSFGIMDGGIDGYLKKEFPKVQDSVFQRLYIGWQGFMPVGCADIVWTGDKKHPHLIVAPTMEYPKRVKDPLVVYNSMRSILRVAQQNKIKTVACSGLATTTGGVAPNVAARLMYRAWVDHNRGVTCRDWAAVQELLQGLRQS